jgi:uncharacterized membrane protein
MGRYVSTRARLGLALGAASIVSVLFFVAGAITNRSWELWYLNWNLLLAWVPLAIMLLLERTLRRRLWSSWQALVLTLLFLAFLPNTFYLMTDIIHLQETTRTDLMLDVVTFQSFILNGCLLGLVSVYLLHAELRKRLNVMSSWLIIAGTLLVTSFAIYIGRELRWNTWDILLNPASILFQISESLLHPKQHPEAFSITLSFFVLTSSLYVVTWFIGRTARQQKMLD